MRFILAGAICAMILPSVALAGEPFLLNDAIREAVRTNPGVGEAAANRRATESELRQVQSTLLPQVRVSGSVGPERFDQSIDPAPLGSGQWRAGREGSVLVRQLVFDGFSKINEIWRQTARVDAAAFRTHERTELIALDAAEAYIEVVRYLRLVPIAEENVTAHRKILANVRSRFEGGRAGEGDLQQATERVEAALASLAQFRQTLDEARAAYRRAIGLEPYNLRFPRRLRGLPASRDDSLAATLRHNPTINAAKADADAARYDFRATAGAFVPQITFEGQATTGKNYNFNVGPRDEYRAKVVASWDIFRGGQDVWRRTELAERYTEQELRRARLQRAAFESIDKAWAARTLTGDRITALIRQNEADRKVIVAYQKEYELGQRSLIDLLNAQNQLFNGLVALVSTRSVAVFADYQLLAAMGHLTEYLKEPIPADAEPLAEPTFGPFPIKLAPIIVRLPKQGPEPLNVAAAEPIVPVDSNGAGFNERWPALTSPNPATWSGNEVQAFNERWPSSFAPSRLTDSFWFGAWQD